MHLLGTSVVAFILLPLAFSCESNTTKEEISRDYKYVIRKQLEDIKTSIEKQLKKPCKDNKNNTSFQLANATSFIHKVSCNRITRHLEKALAGKVTHLVGTINESLKCQCSTLQNRNVTIGNSSRKLCRLKHSLEKIQRAYEQYNSAP